MDEAWPWLALAGTGALHGLNPASGWVFGAACGLRAVVPLALGHLAAVGAVALSVAAGIALDRRALIALAALLLAAALLRHARRRGLAGTPRAGLALWSFIASTGHGAGLMLVPALMPLCAGGPSSALPLALAGTALHLGAMLATCAAMTLAAGGSQALLSRAGGLGRIAARLFITAGRTWRSPVAPRSSSSSATPSRRCVHPRSTTTCSPGWASTRSSSR